MFTLKHLYLMNLANLPEGEVSWLEILQNCQRGKKIREMGYAVQCTRYRTPDEQYRLANGEFHFTLHLKSRQWLGFGLGIGSKLLDKLQFPPPL